MKKCSILLAAVLAFTASVAIADDDGEHDDHKILLEARSAGKVLPLIKILTMVHPITGDNVVDIEFKREGNTYRYGIYYLNKHGRRREVYVDARTGKVLEDGMAD